MPVVLEHRKRPGVVAVACVPLSMRTPALLATYRFRFLPGQPSEKDPIPDAAPVLDEAPTCWVGDDGMLRMLDTDGSVHVAGRARGADAVMPVSMGGAVTTGGDGRARLDWAALRLKAAPSWVDINVVGRPLPYSLDSEPTATGVTVYVEEPKATQSALLKLTILEAGGKPAAGVRLLWHVTA